MAYDSTPVPAGPFGRFTIEARFENVSAQDICNPFFQVVELTVNGRKADRLESISIEPTGQSMQGFDQMVFGHRPFLLAAHTDAWFWFTIDLESFYILQLLRRFPGNAANSRQPLSVGLDRGGGTRPLRLADPRLLVMCH